MFAAISFLIGVSFVLGVLLGIVILSLTRRGKPVIGGPARRPTALGWWTFAFGLTAAMAFVLLMWLPISSNTVGRGLNGISIAFAFAAMVVGIANLVRGDRLWPTWVGIIAGLMPAIFWTTFVAGNLLHFGE